MAEEEEAKNISGLCGDTEMSSKSKKKPTQQMTLNKAVTHAMVIFIWAFASEFSPEQEVFDRLVREVANVRDSVIKGSLTIPAIRKALKDDYNWEVF